MDIENNIVQETPEEEIVAFEADSEEMDTVVTEEYDASQIQVLEGLEAVRKRPGMYIGSTGPRGLHHLVYEIVDNSIDEALAGYCTHIEVEIEPGDIISVRDNGRGIPVGINEKMGLPSVTVVLTVLHAGGKFGGGGYKVSGGLHGVGSSVVNALSEWFEVEVSQAGHVHRQRFVNGGNIETNLEIVGDTEETGTFIRFKPDAKIFQAETPKILLNAFTAMKAVFHPLPNILRAQERSLRSTKSPFISRVQRATDTQKLLFSITTAITSLFSRLQITFAPLTAVLTKQASKMR